MAVNGSNLAEAAANLNFTITLSGQSSQTVTANYATSNGSATAGADYTSKSGTVTFAPGVTSQSIAVGILADNTDEYNETFSVTLTSPSNATLGTAVGTMLINDTCHQFQFLMPHQQMKMLQQNLVASICSVRKPLRLIMQHLTEPQPQEQIIPLALHLSFAPGVTSQNIPVAVLADAVDEVNETSQFTQQPF